jgi:hypothetical protein
MQLVDGGTTDNSAIGTLADIAPSLGNIVSEANARSNGSKNRPFIIPVILYVSNEAGLDLTATANRIKPDALVPLSVIKAAPAAEVTPAAWLTRAAAGYAQVCGAYESAHRARRLAKLTTEQRAVVKAKVALCRAASEAVRSKIPSGVVVAAPATSPAVSVPLGWTLSGFSQAQLNLQADQQATCVPSAAENGSATCRVYEGYGTYGSLLKIFANE